MRLHYVYPYPHVDAVIPLMAEGKILPYLDIPFQHASPKVLKAMKRPGNQEKTLERIGKWRSIAPDLAIRSTFVVGFPGETEEDFQFLLDWLEEAQLDRVGAFAYENVEGAAARDLPGHVPEEVKQQRRERFMAAAARISRAKLKKKVGRTYEVLVDKVRGDGVAVARSYADAPEIDGHVLRLARCGAEAWRQAEGADRGGRGLRPARHADRLQAAQCCSGAAPHAPRHFTTLEEARATSAARAPGHLLQRNRGRGERRGRRRSLRHLHGRDLGHDPLHRRVNAAVGEVDLERARHVAVADLLGRVGYFGPDLGFGLADEANPHLGSGGRG